MSWVIVLSVIFVLGILCPKKICHVTTNNEELACPMLCTNTGGIFKRIMSSITGISKITDAATTTQ